MTEHTPSVPEIESSHDTPEEVPRPERARLKEVLTGFHEAPDEIALELEPNPDEPLEENEVLPEVIYRFDDFTPEQQDALRRGEYVELPSQEMMDFDIDTVSEEAETGFAKRALEKIFKR